MEKLLNRYGGFVSRFPTPPSGPFSIGWRGGTRGRAERARHLTPWPPLHRVERRKRDRAAAVIMALVLPVAAQDVPFHASSSEPVARLNDGRIVTPVNQILTPVGTQVDLPGLRPQALALSPDGKILVTSGNTAELLVLAHDTGRLLQRVRLPAEPG